MPGRKLSSVADISMLFYKYNFRTSSKGACKIKCLGGHFFGPGQWFGQPCSTGSSNNFQNSKSLLIYNNLFHGKCGNTNALGPSTESTMPKCQLNIAGKKLDDLVRLV